MALVIYDIDKESFCVSNPDGDDFVIGFTGEPEIDGSGTLEFHVIEAEGLCGNQRKMLLDAVEEDAPAILGNWMLRKFETERMIYKEDRYM